MEVGIADIRRNLSQYLAAVSDGEEVIITNHNRPVAVMLPYRGRQADPERSALQALISEGRLIPAAEHFTPVKKVKAKDPSALSKALARQRELDRKR